MMHQNLDLGMGKNLKKWGKKYMEREGKSIRFNKLLYIRVLQTPRPSPKFPIFCQIVTNDANSKMVNFLFNWIWIKNPGGHLIIILLRGVVKKDRAVIYIRYFGAHCSLFALVLH